MKCRWRLRCTALFVLLLALSIPVVSSASDELLPFWSRTADINPQQVNHQIYYSWVTSTYRMHHRSEYSVPWPTLLRQFKAWIRLGKSLAIQNVRTPQTMGLGSATIDLNMVNTYSQKPLHCDPGYFLLTINSTVYSPTNGSCSATRVPFGTQTAVHLQFRRVPLLIGDLSYPREDGKPETVQVDLVSGSP